MKLTLEIYTLYQVTILNQKKQMKVLEVEVFSCMKLLKSKVQQVLQQFVET